MVDFVEAAGADFQLHFLCARNQVVFYSYYLLSWCPLHCPITIGRLQSCCLVRPSAMECLHQIEFVCSHQLPHATDVRWRQFGWTLLHDGELSNQPNYSHPQAFHLSTTDQPLWRHQASLHQWSCQRVADLFLDMKNDCMQIKTKQFDFWKTHFHETYFNCVWTFVASKKQIVLIKN